MTGAPGPRVLERMRGSLARRGLGPSLALAFEKSGDALVRALGRPSRYERWLAAQPPLRRGPEGEGPLLSVLLPTRDPERRWLARAVESVRAQSHPHWELCIVDDASEGEGLRGFLRELERVDDRVRSLRLDQPSGISRATNAALEMARGSHFALLDHDDELAPDALREVAAAIELHDPDLLYSDEDKIDARGRLRDPAFKPGFSPDWLLSCNFVSHLGVYRTDLARRLGGFRPEMDGSQDYDLALRFAEHDARILHLPRVLYHWRMVRGSTADPWTDAKPWAYEAARRAIASHLERCGESGRVEDGAGRGFYRVRRPAPTGRALVVVYGEGAREAFADAAAERVVVASARPRASELNEAALRVDADWIAFVDARLRPQDEHWLEVLGAQALRPGVGCVGTRIAAARGRRVLHAGVVLGGEDGIRTERLALFGTEPGPLGASGAARNASAVSGGCIALSRAAYRQLGGFDPDYGASLWDVDLCLRAADASLRVVYEPDAGMRSRQPRLDAPDAADLQRLRARWAARIDAGDPYYNPAFGPSGRLYESRLRIGEASVPPAGSRSGSRR